MFFGSNYDVFGKLVKCQVSMSNYQGNHRTTMGARTGMVCALVGDKPVHGMALVYVPFTGP